jgi:hypothetical protein
LASIVWVKGRDHQPWGGGDVILTDSFGRVATDLRVSLTDRCNLRVHLLHAG